MFPFAYEPFEADVIGARGIPGPLFTFPRTRQRVAGENIRTIVVRMMSASVNSTNRRCRVMYANHSDRTAQPTA